MRKRMLCGAAVALLTLGSVVPCFADSAITRDENGYPDLGGETITIWFNMTNDNAKVAQDIGDYKVIQDLEEKFNVHFEFTTPPVGAAQENFATMIIDELPDMIFCGGIDSFYPGGVEMAYEDGVLYDYTDLVNEENTPNFYKMMQEDEFFRKAVMDDEGRVIRLGAKICGSEEADLNYVGLLIRKDALEATGLDMPESIDDWDELLAAFKENGIEYPLAFDKSKVYNGNTLASAFGISSGYFLDKEGNVEYGPYTDAYKDYLTKLNEWYTKGYINTDFLTDNENDVLSYASAGRVGAVITHLYTYGTTYFLTTEQENPDAAFIPAPIPVLHDGDELAGVRESYRSLGDYKYITADCKNPEACVALLDALYLEDIDRMLTWGVEGVGYEMDGDTLVPLTIPADSDADTLLSVCPQQWHTHEDTDLDFILTKKYNKGCQPDALKLWKEQGTDQSISTFVLYNTEESETMSKYQADVTTMVNEMFAKYVVGQESLDGFEDYQNQLKDLHVEDLMAVRQSAMERYEER